MNFGQRIDLTLKKREVDLLPTVIVFTEVLQPYYNRIHYVNIILTLGCPNFPKSYQKMTLLKYFFKYHILGHYPELQSLLFRNLVGM